MNGLLKISQDKWILVEVIPFTNPTKSCIGNLFFGKFDQKLCEFKRTTEEFAYYITHHHQKIILYSRKNSEIIWKCAGKNPVYKIISGYYFYDSSSNCELKTSKFIFHSKSIIENSKNAKIIIRKLKNNLVTSNLNLTLYSKDEKNPNNNANIENLAIEIEIMRKNLISVSFINYELISILIIIFSIVLIMLINYYFLCHNYCAKKKKVEKLSYHSIGPCPL